MFIPNKPKKYGVKISVFVDFENAYCCNLQVYNGSHRDEKDIGQGSRVVLKLAEYLCNSGQHYW